MSRRKPDSLVPCVRPYDFLQSKRILEELKRDDVKDRFFEEFCIGLSHELNLHKDKRLSDVALIVLHNLDFEPRYYTNRVRVMYEE